MDIISYYLSLDVVDIVIMVVINYIISNKFVEVFYLVVGMNVMISTI